MKTTQSSMKPPLTYYGGKQTMRRHLLPLIPPHHLYCEPFAGGASLFRAKDRAPIEVLNDHNLQLINFYQIAKSRHPDLLKHINQTLHSHYQYDLARLIYKNVRLFELQQIRRARSVRVLANQGFAGQLDSSRSYGRKGNSSGQDAVTVKNLSKRAVMNAQDEHGIYRICERLEQAQLEYRDALETIRNRDTADSFFYVDPPYVVDKGKTCYQGHYSGYKTEDFERLLETLATIKGKFLLSSFSNEVLLKYVEKYKRKMETFVKPLSAQKVTVGGKRKSKTECLIRNY